MSLEAASHRFFLNFFYFLHRLALGILTKPVGFVGFCFWGKSGMKPVSLRTVTLIVCEQTGPEEKEKQQWHSVCLRVELCWAEPSWACLGFSLRPRYVRMGVMVRKQSLRTACLWASKCLFLFLINCVICPWNSCRAPWQIQDFTEQMALQCSKKYSLLQI